MNWIEESLELRKKEALRDLEIALANFIRFWGKS